MFTGSPHTPYASLNIFPQYLVLFDNNIAVTAHTYWTVPNTKEESTDIRVHLDIAIICAVNHSIY